MAFDSQATAVSELVARRVLVINDGYRAKNSELSDHGLPFARGGNINGRFEFNDVDRFPAENLARVGEKISRPGDAVFTSKGTVGRFAFVTEDVERFVYSPQLCFWRSLDREIIDPRWLYFWMHSPEFNVQYSGVKGQTDMADYVSLRDQRRMHITLPPIEKQRAIAAVLGTLDDKILNNQKSNESLHELGRVLFRAWFVDFEPVKAKARGLSHFPGMPGDAFARLPSEFEQSEAGPVPLSWGMSPIDELVEVKGGGTPSTKEARYWERGTNAFCTPRDMAKVQSLALLGTERHLTSTGVERVSSGQLPIGTVLLSSRAPIGYLAVAATPVTVNQGIIALVSSVVPTSYRFYWTETNMARIKARAGGSTFAEISKGNFKTLSALHPDGATLKAYGEIADPLLDLVVSNDRETATLRQTRDRLLSGFFAGALAVPSPSTVW